MSVDPLDAEFPLGDGRADTEAVVVCPYCGESVTIQVDPGEGPRTEYIEDCEVCCQPWLVRVVFRGGGYADVSVSTLDA